MWMRVALPHRPPAGGAPPRHVKASLTISPEPSTSLDTGQRPGYAAPRQRLMEEGTSPRGPSARRGDRYDQGRAHRAGGRHRGPVESADGRGAHAVLAGDYGGPAGGRVRGIAGLWPLLPPSPPGAGWTEPPHGANDPDPGESRPHLYRGEGVPGTGATPHRGGRRCVRSTPDMAATHAIPLACGAGADGRLPSCGRAC